MLGKVFKAYDIRGTYPDPLNEQMAWQIGYGCSKYLLHSARQAGESTPMMRNIVVGRDMRKSSPSLTKSLMQGINDHGGYVLDVGLVDTPLIYFAINHFDCAGGVMTTASHNPPQYNGFKISTRKARPVGEATGLAEVRKHAAMVDRATMTPGGGRTEARDLWGPYAAHVRQFLKLSGRRLRVVVDASNGMAGTMVPRVFGPQGGGAISGLSIIEVNFENSKGEFVHDPNPLVAANLAQLRERVVKERADLGVCFDGDADRCVVVDEKGRVVGCDHLTAVLAKHVLKQPGGGGGAVVYDLRSTRALPEEIAKAGGAAVRSRVGHVFVKAAMAEHKAVLGGEVSGHFYFRDNYYADSGAIAMAMVLTVLSASGKKLSQLVSPVRRYAQSGEINYVVEEQDAAMARLRETFKTVPADTLDGVTLDAFERQGWWCNVRKSNTEALLRLNLEARDAGTLDRILRKVEPLLGPRARH